jgi:hypothetical protein
MKIDASSTSRQSILWSLIGLAAFVFLVRLVGTRFEPLRVIGDAASDSIIEAPHALASAVRWLFS